MRTVLPYEVQHRLGIGRAAKANPAVANFLRFNFAYEPGHSFADETATRFAEQIDPAGEVIGGTEDGLRPRLAESGRGYEQCPVVGIVVFPEPRSEMAGPVAVRGDGVPYWIIRSGRQHIAGQVGKPDGVRRARVAKEFRNLGIPGPARYIRGIRVCQVLAEDVHGAGWRE